MRGRILDGTLLMTLALGCLGLSACASRTPVSNIPNDSTPSRIALKDFVKYVANRVERAADDIAQATDDSSIRRTTVYWKMRVIPLAQDALLAQEDAAAVIQLWVLSVAMKQAFEGPLGEHLLDGQSIAVEAAEEIELQAASLARSLLPPEQFQEYEPRINDIVGSHTAGGRSDRSSDEPTSWDQALTSVLTKPLHLIQAPLSSLNPTSGLSDTAAAVQNFTDEFSRARTDLDSMPRQMRWQVQLLLMEIEETIRLSAMTDGVAQIGASADSLAQTANALPGELRAELTAFAADLGKPQSELRETLHAANATLTNSQQTARSLDEMGATWTAMFEAFQQVMAGFEKTPDEHESRASEAETPPFDINDYGRTAEKLTETANALTILLADVDELSNRDQAPALLVETGTAARSILDRFFLGAAALIVFAAGVGYAYRRAVAGLKQGRGQA